MTRPKSKALAPAVPPLNFLLTCSEATLDGFELAKLAAIANLRSELHDVLDKLIEEGVEAGLARWFKNHGRDEIKHAVENPPDLLAEAKKRIRTQGRSGDELLPVPSLPPGKAHLAAALRYAERNIAEGKCCVCPKPLARNSVRYCERHLAIARARHKPLVPRANRQRASPGCMEMCSRVGMGNSLGLSKRSLRRARSTTAAAKRKRPSTVESRRC